MVISMARTISLEDLATIGDGETVALVSKERSSMGWSAGT